MKGTARQIQMCGTTIDLGDEIKVRYDDGYGEIGGVVTELWSPATDNTNLQARLSCGWCFHNWDHILSHKKIYQPDSAILKVEASYKAS